MLTDYLIHIVTILRGGEGPHGTGRDDRGEPLSIATPVSLSSAARVEWDTRKVMGANGQETVAAGIVFLPNTVDDIGINDQIVFEGRIYAVVSRNRCEGWSWLGDSRSHWEVYIV